MQINVQKLSPVLMEFAVEISADRVRAEVDRAYNDLARTARVRGYRPGKAPRDVLVHIYGDQVISNVAQRLVDDTLPKAFAEKSVQPLTMLSLSPSKLNITGPFSYKVRFEVSPDIESVKYEGLPVKRPSTKVTEELVQQELETLRHDQALLRTPDPTRPAQHGDVVVIDFTLQLEGKPLKDTAGQGVEAELGSGKLLKELEEGLIGTSAGEHKDIEVTFPAVYQRAELRGKTALFQVDVKEVKERILPELDDDFAKDLGTFETLEALKKDVSENLEKKLAQQVEQAVAEQLIVELCKANPIPIPPSLVQKQVEATEQELTHQSHHRGTPLAFTDELRNRILADAEVKVQAGLLMAAIARSQQLRIIDEDIEKAYVDLAEQTSKNVARIKAEYRDPKKREMLLGLILEDKILNLIEAKAVFTDEGSEGSSSSPEP